MDAKDYELMSRGFASYDAASHDTDFKSRRDAFGANTIQPWVKPEQAAACLRTAVLVSPACPDGNKLCSRSADSDGKRWIVSDDELWRAAVRRIQFDQKTCSLKELYAEYKSFPHSPEERAATCLGMLVHDPSLRACLDENREVIVRIINHPPEGSIGQHASTSAAAASTAASSPVTYGGDTPTASYTALLTQHLYGMAFCDPDFDAVLTWLHDVVYPQLDEKQYSARQWKMRIDLYWAYKNKDRDGLLNIMVSAPWGSDNVDRAFSLLLVLGLKGDEYQKAKALGASEHVLPKLDPAYLKTMNVEALKKMVCYSNNCGYRPDTGTGK